MYFASGTPMLNETVFRGRRLAIVGSICRDVKMGVIRPGKHLLEDGETPTTFVKETIGGGGANRRWPPPHWQRTCGFAERSARIPLGSGSNNRLSAKVSLHSCGVIQRRLPAARWS